MRADYALENQVFPLLGGGQAPTFGLQDLFFEALGFEPGEVVPSLVQTVAYEEVVWSEDEPALGLDGMFSPFTEVREKIILSQNVHPPLNSRLSDEYTILYNIIPH